MPIADDAADLCEGCKARGERTLIAPGQRLCDRCVKEGGSKPPGPAQERASWIRHEIANWQQARVISPRMAQRILALYEPNQGPSLRRLPRGEDDWPDVHIPMTPGMVLLYLGGLLILTAVLLIASDLWKDLEVWGRFEMVAVPVAALYAVGAYLFRRDGGYRAAGTVLLLFACLGVPAVLFLGLDLWSHGMAARDVSLIVATATLVVHAASLSAFHSPVLTIPYPFALIWVMWSAGDVVSERRGAHTVLVAMLLGGLALMVLAILTRLQRKPAYAAVPEAVGTFTALIALTLLGDAGRNAGWETVAIAACLGAIAASVFRRNQIYLMAGSLLLMANILAIGFEGFEHAVGLPIALSSCGLLIIAVGYVVQRVRQEYILDDW